MKRRYIVLAVLISGVFLLWGCGERKTEIKNTEAKATEVKVTEVKVTEVKVTEVKVTEAKDTEAKVTEADIAEVQAAETETAAQPQMPETTADGFYVQAAPALYISLGNGEFVKYPFEGENTPEALVAGIAELTGWNLNLSEQIYSGKGGMTVIFAPDSALFTGPPEKQKEEFHVYDSEQMAFAILDSVRWTLQNYASSVYPENVDIYIGAEHDQPLVLETLGVTWPLEEPYSHEKLKEMLGQE